MRADVGPDRQALSDEPPATRAPSPSTLESIYRVDPATSSDQALVAPTPVVGVNREEFERVVASLGLMDIDSLREFRHGLPADEASSAEGLARALIREGRLTRYQGSAIYQGKARVLTIGPYVVLDKLGAGGMGMVFKARRRSGGPPVALKLLPPSASKNSDAVQRFRREAEMMARLEHPNLVSAYEVGEYGGVHYIVMDFVEGRDLDRLVRSSGPLKVARAVELILQAARGLRTAHVRGIVHRDIKPANLLLDTKGVVRVLDLGLARFMLGDGGESDGGPSLTRSGVIMGTVDYLPPEQADDSKRADHRADMYSLACTLHFLLTGRPPFTGDSLLQRVIAHHQRPAPSLSEARRDVPAQLDALFQRMMAKSPEDRPRSIVEVISELEAIQALPPSPKGLRIFDDGRGSAPPLKTTRIPGDSSLNRPMSPTTTELSDGDLLTFIRSEWLANEDKGAGEPAPARPAPTSPRQPRRIRRRKSSPIAIASVMLGVSAIGATLGFIATRHAAERPRDEPPPKQPEARAEPKASAGPIVEQKAEAPLPPPEPPPVRVAAPEPHPPIVEAPTTPTSPAEGAGLAGSATSTNLPRTEPLPPSIAPGPVETINQPMTGGRKVGIVGPRPGDPGFGPPLPLAGAIRRTPSPGDPGYGPVLPAAALRQALRPGDPGFGPPLSVLKALQGGLRPGDPGYGPVPGSPGFPGPFRGMSNRNRRH